MITPPCAGITGAAGEPVNPVGFKVARFHPAQPVNRVHLGHNAGADQVGDEAHYFDNIFIHNNIFFEMDLGKELSFVC